MGYNLLGQILRNYNVFVRENYEGTHVVGAIAAGGSISGYGGTGGIAVGGGTGTSQEAKDYVYPVPMYVGGSKQGIGNIKLNGTDPLPLILGATANTDENGDAKDCYDWGCPWVTPNDNVYFSDNWIDFDAIMPKLTQQAKALYADSPIEVSLEGDQIKVENNPSGKVQYIEGRGLVVQPGATVKFKDMSSMELLAGTIVLDVTDYADPHKIPDTVIGYDGTDDAIVPGIVYVRKNGSNYELDKQFKPDTEVPADGIPFITVYPNTKKVSYIEGGSNEGKYLNGHLVAPEADVDVGGGSGNFNGTYIGKSVKANCEGHMWPYNGTRLSIYKPDTFSIQAHKSLIGRQLNNQEFTFEVYKAKNHWFGVSAWDSIEWIENGLVGTKTNGADGDVNFDPIDITEEDFHSGWTIIDWTSICPPSTNKSCSITKNFGYIVKEKVPDTRDPDITYDQTVFRVTVPATITFDYSVNSADPDVTIVAGTPTYSLGSGNIADHLQEGKPHFINVADTTKLKIQKEIEGYDESKDSEVIFSFQVSLELPDGMSLQAADSSSTQPQKLFFDDITDPKNRTTYGYACVANDAKNGCKRSGESNVATRQEFYIPEGTTIVLPDDYAQQFRVEIEPIQNTKRSHIKLIAKNTGNPPVVPSEISWPQLVVGSPSSTYVQCPSNPNKKCTQITLNVTGQGSAELEKLPLGTKYTIAEQPSDAFSLVGFNGGTEQSASGELTGKDSSGNKIEYITVTAKNKRKPKPVSLVIMKRVVDANTQEIREGLPDDAVFTIAINLYKEGSQNNRVSGEFDYKKTGDGQEEESGKLSCNADGCSPVTLKPWQTITITGLPEGTQFNVAETDAGGFEHVSTVVSQPATCASTFAASQTACQLNDGAQGVVTVTNRYVTVVLPETGGKAHPFMTMLFGVGVVCAGLLITAIYMRRQGMAMLQ